MKMVRLPISQILVVNLINLIVLNDVRPSKYIYVYYINYIYLLLVFIVVITFIIISILFQQNSDQLYKK